MSTINTHIPALLAALGISADDLSLLRTSELTNDNGLSATYFNNEDLTGPQVTRIEPVINFNWGSGSPDPAITPDHFSARWTGQVMPQHSETYTFYTWTDDGVRLWVDNQLLIDEWHPQPATGHSGSIELEAGKFYDIKLEYFERGGQAVAELHWESPSLLKEIIPQSQLFTDDNRLNLANLSHLSRTVLLAKTLKLSMRDFLAVKALTGISPLFDPTEPSSPVHPADTLHFVEKVRKIRASGFSIAELDYLLRHEDQIPAALAPAEESVALILTEIRNGLQKIAAETTIGTDPTNDLIRKKLAIILESEELVEEAMKIIEDGSARSADAASDQNDFIDAHFGEFMDTTEAKTQFVGSPPASPALTEMEKRFTYVLEQLRDTLSKNLVTQKLANTFDLDVSVAEQLLTERVKSPNEPTKAAITEILKKDFVESEDKITEADFEQEAYLESLFKTFVLLHKVAMVISKFRIKLEELSWVFEHSATLSSLDLNTLPVDNEAPPASFDDLEWLIDLIQLRDGLPACEPALFEILNPVLAFNRADYDDPAELENAMATAQANFLQALRERTGWSEAELDCLIGPQGFNFEFPDDYRNKDKRALIRLKACFVLIKRLGVAASEVQAWTETGDIPAVEAQNIARSIKQAVKAKYDDDRWLKVARPLKDALREQQRSALVAYLVARHGLRDSNDLYDYFLIDPEMAPCMLTSRLKQANNTVQLFVQRCAMGLEPRVHLTPAEVKRWGWMKNYRVWEANRKVFLYPENWIEPELRDNKSPFFKDLENELLQNEVTLDTAETAFLHYLEKLDEAARLEIAGLYHEEKVDILHVFGRTRNTPHIYYYRQRVNESYWTPWERVDVDIEENHLIPVVWNRRLYLFWPIFEEKQEERTVTMPAANEELAPGRKYWEIKLAWSEYRNGKWSAKKVSQNHIEYHFFPKGFFYFSAFKTYSHLSILVYHPWAYNKDVLLVPGAEFRLVGCDGTINSITDPIQLTDHSWQISPLRTYQENMRFLEKITPGNDRLYVIAGPDIPPMPDPKTRLIECLKFLNSKRDVPILNKTPDIFSVIAPHQYPQFLAQAPFFYEDDTRTFLVVPKNIPFSLRAIWILYAPEAETPPKKFRFEAFCHPYVCEFIKQLTRYGIDGLLDPSPDGELLILRRQLIKDDEYFEATYDPQAVDKPYPIDEIDYSYRGAYSLYNWELFFHAPLLIADRLSKNQRFEEAQQWFHYIFDPTDVSISGLRAAYFNNPNLKGPAAVTRFDPTIEFDWRVDPFDPGVDPDHSSVRWTGKVLPQHSETYTFYTLKDHGVRLWVDNQLLIDDWNIPPTIARRGTIALEAGNFYDLKMEYFQEAEGAIAELRWESPSTPKEIIPAHRLCPAIPYWKVRPFFNDTDGSRRIEKLMRLLNEGDEALAAQVDEWRYDPFKPHLIARMRLIAYQKAVVMKYIDNLIAWGDQLFRRDTIESMNEATQLYILAAQILGPRPENIPPPGEAPIKTYNELEPDLDEFSNALVQLENRITGSAITPTAGNGGDGPPPPLSVLYFCIPKNDKLLSYWDTVADRLFKIRHCMTIEGVERQLPLFEPPIDPALLVRAAAAGVDISSALNDINAALPHYRFQVMLQKALEFCNDVRNLGGALLSALEKRDAEALALLRSGYELQLLNAAREIKEQQIKEANSSLKSLKKSHEVVTIRKDYYETRTLMSPWEITHLALMGTSIVLRTLEAVALTLAGGLHLIPNVKVGSPTTAGTSSGGDNLGQSAEKHGASVGRYAALLDHSASMAATMGSHWRRMDDWQFQGRLAAKELEQIDKQIMAAETRLEVAKQELKNHDLQIENAKEVDDFMRDKFTNQELYNWMVGQISTLYFQSYQMAYDLAKRAEKAYRHELGLSNSNFIQFGYWDSLKKGLLAGEKLHYDLKRMELAYFDQNKREFELTKSISLAMLDPFALVMLKETGECFVNLPEAIFDLDYPGHFMRRIKSVSLTIPCVTGPYTGVNCTLTLLTNEVRIDNSPTGNDGNYWRDENGDDPRFRNNIGAIQSIATSNAQNDSGLFELNFRDERYLPFEGAGAISQWRLELAGKWRTTAGEVVELAQFDFDTISDIIFHLRYTARDGGSTLKDAAVGALRNAIEAMKFGGNWDRQGLFRLFSARHEFPGEWHRFLHPRDTADKQTLQFPLTPERFPFQAQGKTIQLGPVELFLKLKDGKDPASSPPGKTYLEEYADGNPLNISFTSPGPATGSGPLKSNPSFMGGIPHLVIPATDTVPVTFELGASDSDIQEIADELQHSVTAEGETHYRLNSDAIEDIYLLCHYAIT